MSTENQPAVVEVQPLSRTMTSGDFMQPTAMYSEIMFKDIKWTAVEARDGEPQKITGTIHSLVGTQDGVKHFLEHFGNAKEPQDLHLTAPSGRLTFRKFMLTEIGPTGVTSTGADALAVGTRLKFMMRDWYYGATPPDVTAENEKEGCLPDELVDEILKKRVFVMIGGQTFPNQHDLAGPYIPIVDDYPSPKPEYWVKNLGQLPTPLRPIWPRHSFCKVSCSGAAGTIDELTALFRQQLEKAARSVVRYKVAPYTDHEKSIENAKVHGYDPTAGKAVTFEPSKMGDPKTADWLRKSSAILSTIMASPLGEMPHKQNAKFAELMSQVDPSEPNPVQMIYRDGKPAYLVAREDEDELKRIARALPYDIDGVKICYRLLPPCVDRIDLFNPPESSQSVMDPNLIDNG